MKDKISVALCTYNGEQFLEEQLDSIISQSQSVDEIIVCDDGSTDDTLKIIESYKLKFPNLIKFYSNEEKLHTIKNFEKAITLTTGSYVFLSDQDDVWDYYKVESMMKVFGSNEKYTLLFTNALLIDEKGEELESNLWEKWAFNEPVKKRWQTQKNQIIDLIQNKNKVTGATIAFKSVLKEAILPLNLPKNVWHDCYMALMAAKNNGLFFLDDKLVKYRVHKGQQVGISTVNTPVNEFTVSLEAYRDTLMKKFRPYMPYFDGKYFPKQKSNKNVFTRWFNKKTQS